MMTRQSIYAETRRCKLEGCRNTFQTPYKGRKREYCSNICKCKDHRLKNRKKIKEFDLLKLQKQKLVALLTPNQRKKAHDWGLLG